MASKSITPISGVYSIIGQAVGLTWLQYVGQKIRNVRGILQQVRSTVGSLYK